ncbi:MAG: hypothetical protein IT321_16415 [Anaerolineae bacterium]|nr:hypothetical protein [Anaerolineae bacterium]
MKLTRKLWRWLNRAQAGHPLYQRIITQAPYVLPWYMGCAIILLSPILLLPGIVFLSAVYGLRWAVQIASSIAHERESGMYDLLVTTPPGIIGVSRVVMSACLNRNETLEQTQAGGTWIMRGFFTIVLMLIAASVSPPIIPPDAYASGGLIIFIYLGTMAAAMYIDHVHSIVLAVEIGLWIPSYATRRLDAGAAAFIAYLVVQVSTFVITLLLGFTIAPAVFQMLALPAVISAILLPFIRLATFAGVREVIIHYLWGMVVRETQATPSEVEAMGL